MANKTLEKIDSYLKDLDEKKHKKKKLPFLEGKDEEYQKVFRAIAKKHGIDPEEIENLDKDKKKKFFDAVDKAWKADKETD
jgi:hypothetical protein